jgi:hypothetical protein
MVKASVTNTRILATYTAPRIPGELEELRNLHQAKATHPPLATIFLNLGRTGVAPEIIQKHFENAIESSTDMHKPAYRRRENMGGGFFYFQSFFFWNEKSRYFLKAIIHRVIEVLKTQYYSIAPPYLPTKLFFDLTTTL